METPSAESPSPNDSSYESALPSSRIDATELSDAVDRIRDEIGTILVGQTDMVDLFLTALLADGHVLIEGVPGVAKTLTARLVARALNVDFTRIQFTPDLMPSDVLGTSVFNPKTTEFTFRKGPVFSNVVLIDEINRAPAKTQAALFEVMEERQVSADGTTWPLDTPFVVFATQNPLEHEGTYRLPEAQLDRFLFKIQVDYPGLDDEVDILRGHHVGRGPDAIEQIEPVINAETLSQFRALVQDVHVEIDLMRYIAEIAHHTREHRMLSLGASPRASVAMLNAAKAFTVLRGRDFVSPDDVQAIALPALRHRLMLTPEQEMEGKTTDAVIRRVLDEVDVPR
ncbi:magnesium chelatase [Longibacter salinarum]|uniref:Magnesium chelatase n=1 Tax=Longibacter salinarum TaxID=1850348 RepID=A0A2A8D237_9BACT|nr:MoxR family ATPase [Longibacter salinarum]PEN14883.1 magnesium chelatase [Longibacter salinarum]